ncbi:MULTISPECIES: dihydroxyacetone kinase subunit DhaL [Nocardiopsis]|uniref:Dihydroxyacetone kinase subunit L n=1 Tax=Nocardiopsis sinuspersici TaxID=501010 RepID=A0A1V3C0T2_9ACTN|nr:MULTISPECIES: dihydroxyacetone kinase subunit DhaL [Nocardiopsis]OOC54106.1 dihydroxyacetone kinase subunit L [Nocardiopsis sinuspersici]
MAEQLSPSHVERWVHGFVDTVEESGEYLTDLDRRSGDGDFGTNMVTALRRARRAMAGVEATTVGVPFQVTGETFLAHSGGTSGPLFGMWFRDFGKVGADAGALTLAMLAEATENGWATVARLGSAEVGDRTMVDAIAPASVALNKAVGDGSGLVEGLRSAAEAARVGAEGTSELLGRRGRTSYVGESALGSPDPGAVTIALFYRAAVESATA